MTAPFLHLSAVVWPHLVAVALCGARLLPISFLSPALGGQSTPSTTRLALVLALAMSLHMAGGVAPTVPVEDGWRFAGLALREVALGLTMGLVAALPFDAARMGGRFIDLFRGASAEAALPWVGARESASGNGLYGLTVAVAAVSGALTFVLGSLWHSFAVVTLGAYVPTENGGLRVATVAGAAMATGLAIGAPIAALSLVIDLVVGLASRGAGPMRLQEIGTPLRILGGGAVLWLGLGLVCDRVMAEWGAVDGALRLLLEGRR